MNGLQVSVAGETGRGGSDSSGGLGIWWPCPLDGTRTEQPPAFHGVRQSCEMEPRTCAGGNVRGPTHVTQGCAWDWDLLFWAAEVNRPG